jgi:hypothetical protein
MRRSANVIVFARAPLLGAVKRRLAAEIGAAAARRVYVEISASVVRRLRDRRWRLWLATTPDRFALRGRFWRRGPRRFGQGRGDLGARMERALAAFRTGPVVVVGSDIPALAASHIRHALAALGGHDVVFGPAGDGGYWLVGVKEPRLARGLFRGVRWSGPHALADTRANVPRHRRVALVDELDDIDDAAAWRRWRVLRRTRASGAPAAAA